MLGLLGTIAVSAPVASSLEAAEVEVAWNANPSEENVAGYRLHYGITSGHYENTDDVGNASSAVITNLGDDSRYFIALTAYNQDGLESDFSEEFEFTTPAISEETDDDDSEEETDESNDGSETNPDGDGNEDGDGTEAEGELPTGNATADLIWNANPETDGVAGYRLYYGTASGSYPAMLDMGNTTSVTVTGLAENTAYFVVLTAYNDEGMESAPSEEFQFLSSQNLPPKIILTKIGGEGITPTSGSLILLATARDEDGHISQVDFYDGTRLLHSDVDFPYALRVSGLGAGIHQLHAVAIDNFGNEAESDAVSVQVAAASALPDTTPPDTALSEKTLPTLTLSLSPNGKTPLLTVTATPGSRVRLEASENLSDWDLIAESSADDLGNVEITDPTPEEELPGRRFYRVVNP